MIRIGVGEKGERRGWNQSRREKGNLATALTRSPYEGCLMGGVEFQPDRLTAVYSRCSALLPT